MTGERLHRTIEPVWSRVRDIRREVGARLASTPEELRRATMMTASELMENAIKYGESVPAAPRIEFTMTSDGGEVRIVVVNGTTDVAAVGELRHRVSELARAEDKTALYVSRLQQLLANSAESGKLGIYRIGSEGGFDLECEYADSVVTVVAVRRIG